MRLFFFVFGILATGLSVQPAGACNCPKEQLLKEYGSVSMLGGLRPLPFLKPAAPTAIQGVAQGTSLPGSVEGPAPTLKVPMLSPGLIDLGSGLIPARGEPFDAILLEP